jgi:hypothetical protein
MDHTLDVDLELKNRVQVQGEEFLVETQKIEVRHSWLNQHNEVFVYATMIFPNDLSLSKHDQEPLFFEKYATVQEAKTGHKKILDTIEEIIKKVKNDSKA